MQKAIHVDAGDPKLKAFQATEMRNAQLTADVYPVV